MARGQSRTKYNVNKSAEGREYDGIVFDSELEMRYYRDVILPQSRSGQIASFELQKKYELQPKFTHEGKSVQAIVYVADFYVEYADGRCEVIDTKGFADSAARMKRKLFWYKYPELPYHWICYSKIDGGWCDYDDVQKNRKERKRQKEQLKAQLELQKEQEENT